MTHRAGLIADIGGTNARFALADGNGFFEEKIFKCADYSGPAEAARAYLDAVRPEKMPHTAAIAIAAAVTGDLIEMANHHWRFSIADMQKTLGLAHLSVMNDFKAIALAIPHLKPHCLRQIGTGRVQPQAPIGIIGPGTGLGVASLVWDGTRYRAVPGEGGHVTMPSRTQREFDVFQEIMREKTYHHISAERVCSGKGLVNIYNALRALDGRGDLPERTPEEISKAAISGACGLCHEALSLMIGFLGTIAGNLALTIGAHGGIYIAGGIVMQLGEYFYESDFRKQFTSKGRLEDYLAPIPTFVITHSFPAFVGLQADLAEWNR